jgi:hypothetical protein
VLVLGAACSSSAKPASTPSTESTTTPSSVPPNAPFAIGALVPLTNGWHAEVSKVQRPFASASLTAPPAGRQYVAVDVALQNDGPGSARITATKIYALVDARGREYAPSRSSGVDGQYPPGTTRQGRLVFAVPIDTDLTLKLDGVRIGTQNAVWQIDPPARPSGD